MAVPLATAGAPAFDSIGTEEPRAAATRAISRRARRLIFLGCGAVTAAPSVAAAAAAANVITGIVAGVVTAGAVATGVTSAEAGHSAGAPVTSPADTVDDGRDSGGGDGDDDGGNTAIATARAGVGGIPPPAATTSTAGRGSGGDAAAGDGGVMGVDSVSANASVRDVGGGEGEPRTAVPGSVGGERSLATAAAAAASDR